jgi:hypothetical protein
LGRPSALPPCLFSASDVAGGNITKLTINFNYGTVETPLSINRENITTRQVETSADRLKVFLCHSSNDKPIIRKLYERLLLDGIQPWLDEIDLIAGQDWQYEIPKAVKSSDVVIVCLSQSSMNRAGYFHREIRFALDVTEKLPDGAVFVIPVRLDDCVVPEKLSKWHWVNFFEATGYDKLKQALLKRAHNLGRNTSVVKEIPQEVSTKKEWSLLEDLGFVDAKIVPSIGDTFIGRIFDLDHSAVLVEVPHCNPREVVGVIRAEHLLGRNYKRGNTARVQVVDIRRARNDRLALELKPVARNETDELFVE